MRRCYLFFHGRDGAETPQALGGIGVDTLTQAVDVMRKGPPMPAHRDLAGHWCCSFAEVETDEDEEPPQHPESCHYRFRLSARGKISRASIVQ